VNVCQIKSRQAEASTQTDRQATKGVDIVYYLLRADGTIKIGTSRRPLTRLAEHKRRGENGEVVAIEFGGRDLERQRHLEFAHLRDGRFEHFDAAPDLMAHIATLRKALNLSA
jgi:hypothetical protein